MLIREIYGMLVASLLWYKKFKKDLKSIGFAFNKYYNFVSTMMVNEKQHTV